ncbi:LCP family protein [Streptomyces daliensis]|uniref:LCP family protein n=1 Tax=Streptomyces daliensis TaxID=299421 RepID=A0A8T4ISS4_9ACTN|nr:LCP family protein [Streptomyces daliensis]
MSESAGGPLPPQSSSTLYRAAPRWHRRGHAPEPGRQRGGPRRALRRACLVVLVLAVLLAAVVGATWIWAGTQLRETAAFAGDDVRSEAGEGTNWLVIGTDTRSDLSADEREELHVGGAGERNTDTMMLLHYGDAGPYLVSIPRDSYVTVPGHGKAKINSAYALGGPKLLTRTVEAATGLRLDHYAEVDFHGFVGVVDALDGVEICLDAPLKDEKAGADLRAGCQTLDGRQALAFVRARYSDPEGDLGRVRRQRQLLSALVHEATGPATLLNPFRLHGFLDATLEALTVDNGTGVPSLTRMAWEIRGLTGGDGGTATVPVTNAGLSVPGAGDVVVWDRSRAGELFDQLRRDVPITATEVK